MEQPKALNLTDGWEDIVNNSVRRKARTYAEFRRHQRQCDKVACKAIVCVFVAAILMVLGLTGLLASEIANPSVVILICSAFFFFGRFWEVHRK